MQRLAVIFGGQSVEHEVSVITALQAMEALDKTEIDAIPVYISKAGDWLTGDPLRNVANYEDLDRLLHLCSPVALATSPRRPALQFLGSAWQRWSNSGSLRRDLPLHAALPVTHGGAGEDGSLQGLLRMAGLPHTCSDVEACAISMNKIRTKTVLRAAGIPVLDDVHGPAADFMSADSELVQAAEARFGYPMVIKPANLGSSIAVSRVRDRDELALAAATVAAYDQSALVEPAQDVAMEVNCAVMGDHTGAIRASACEQVERGDILTYELKYARGENKTAAKAPETSGRVIPALLPERLTGSIQATASAAFDAIGCFGVVRVDLFVDPAAGTHFVNEVNTIPGSLSYYLWEPVGLSYTALLGELVGMAVRRAEDERRLTRAIEPWLLSSRAQNPKAFGAKSLPD
jgi:D-alanine-D-alanine ligase